MTDDVALSEVLPWLGMVHACGPCRPLIDWLAARGETSSFAQAWSACPDGLWLAWLVADLPLKPRERTLIAVAAARTALPDAPEGDRDAVAVHLATLDAWVRGEATDAAREVSREALGAMSDRAHRASARSTEQGLRRAAFAVSACHAAFFASDTESYAAESVFHAANRAWKAAWRNDYSLRDAREREIADAIRGALPIGVMLRALRASVCTANWMLATLRDVAGAGETANDDHEGGAAPPSTETRREQLRLFADGL